MKNKVRKIVSCLIAVLMIYNYITIAPASWIYAQNDPLTDVRVDSEAGENSDEQEGNEQEPPADDTQEDEIIEDDEEEVHESKGHDDTGEEELDEDVLAEEVLDLMSMEVHPEVVKIDMSDVSSGTGYTFASNCIAIDDGGIYEFSDSGSTTNIRIDVKTEDAVTLILSGIEISNIANAPIDMVDQAKVTILLPDGKENLLNAESSSNTKGHPAIHVPEHAVLTIDVPQSDEGTGALTAKAEKGAAIGARGSEDNGEVRIDGGNVVVSSDRGAGIGGGGFLTLNTAPGGGSGGVIKIGGHADVTAEAVLSGAPAGSGESITIKDKAQVTAKSQYGAGIGGGYGNRCQGGNGGTILITGGTITATSGTATTYDNSAGAGIGGGGRHAQGNLGDGGSGGNIIISGGSVTASAHMGAGIGGGGGSVPGTIAGSGGEITISGGTVAASSNKGSGIGGGMGSVGRGGHGGVIAIKGTADVTAIGGEYSSAIGGAYGSENYKSVISKDGSHIGKEPYGEGAELTIDDTAVVRAYTRYGYALHTKADTVSGGGNVANLYVWNDNSVMDVLHKDSDVTVTGTFHDKSHTLSMTLPGGCTSFAFTGDEGLYGLLTEEAEPRRIVYYQTGSDIEASGSSAQAKPVTFKLPDNYTVIYDGNGNTSGSVPVDENKYNSGDTVKVLGNTGDLSKEHHSFLGWSTDSSATAPQYEAEDQFDITDHTVLFAVWKPVPLRVTYKVNGGVGEDVEDTSEYNAAYHIRTLEEAGFTYDKRTFSGWNTDPQAKAGAPEYAEDTTITLTENLVLHAIWQEIPPKTSGSKRGSLTVTFYRNDGTDQVYEKQTVTPGAKVTEPAAPKRAGCEFAGWYLEPTGKTEYDFQQPLQQSLDLYAKWTLIGEMSEEGETYKQLLNKEDHYAYLVGYPDGAIRPDANITRAEAATAFFRLLKPDVREDYYSSSNRFYDVNQSDWHNKAISTMNALGIAMGDEDGSFRPNDNITRAEFAALAARFAEGGSDLAPVRTFTDIEGHWAADSIVTASRLGWVSGYGDALGGTSGSFRPDAYITRAEVTSLVNRVLEREPEAETDMLTEMKRWSDNPRGSWYYLSVQEATNSHSYAKDDGVHEHWTGLEEDPDWLAWERPD